MLNPASKFGNCWISRSIVQGIRVQDMCSSLCHNSMDFSPVSYQLSCKFNYPDCSNTSRNAKNYGFSGKGRALLPLDPECGMEFFGSGPDGLLLFFFIHFIYSIRSL